MEVREYPLFAFENILAKERAICYKLSTSANALNVSTVLDFSVCDLGHEKVTAWQNSRFARENKYTGANTMHSVWPLPIRFHH